MSKISWEWFSANNPNEAKAFEDLCRGLFRETILNGADQILHSNPNNPGIEVEPVMNSNGQLVSFQAKYFSGNTNYQHIKASAEQAVKHYQGKLDILYLYCNKDINTSSKSYSNIEKILNDANIQLKLVTNNEILDRVRQIPWIADAFFHVQEITKQWYCGQVRSSLEALGEKYNERFNVDTDVDQSIELFLHDSSAIERINLKKRRILNELRVFWHMRGQVREYLNDLTVSVSGLPDIDTKTIKTSLQWHAQVLCDVDKSLKELRRIFNERKDSLSELDKKTDEYHKRYRDVRLLEKMIVLPDLLKFSEQEEQLLIGDLLLLKGDAGVGKSQTLAHHAAKRVEVGKCSLLLQGSEFLTNDGVFEQIPKLLNLNCNFEELLSALKRAALRENGAAVLFIDAINECENKEVWRRDLSKVFDKVANCKSVKVILSIRSNYEKLLINPATEKKIGQGQIIELRHDGFRADSIRSIRDFFNRSNIPFSPYYFRSEMMNPLFLTLFCKVYDGSDFNLFALFEKLVEYADREAQKAIGYAGDDKQLPYLIKDLMRHFMSSQKRLIERESILKLDFWNTYGIDKKTEYLKSLRLSGLLTTFVHDETEFYDITYDLMHEYLYAKEVINLYPTQEKIRDFLKHDLLGIKNGKIENWWHQELFAIICSLYAEKYHNECFDIIEEVQDNEIKDPFFDRYLQSFSYRKKETIQSNVFCDFVVRTHRSVNAVYDVLIENSTKLDHPLNVDFLHNHLFNMTLAERDAQWTTFINEQFYEGCRIFQLIEFFESEKEIDSTHKNCRHLLVLFSWFLAASNRKLRDRTSQAMINILKEDIENCTWLLQKFEGVNDPHIIERLYGIVFGACLKRTNEQKSEFLILAKYVYNNIFMTTHVYPGIWLRESARLIVERCLYEYPQETGWIKAENIMPPYRSPDIPVVKEESYHEEGKYEGGFFMMAVSMSPDGVVSWSGCNSFYRAVEMFESVDPDNVYHASMQYIRDTLGYTNDLFSGYDSRRCPEITERIGEKYQWIAASHMLARIADNHLIVTHTQDSPHQFKGLWEIDFRDFDPTFNEKMQPASGLPELDCSKHEIDWDGDATQWLNDECPFFTSSDLIICDTTGERWVFLYQSAEELDELGNIAKIQGNYCVKGSKRIRKQISGCFCSKQDFGLLQSAIQDTISRREIFPKNGDEIRFCNRELPWSSNCEELRQTQWREYSVAKERKVIKRTVPTLKISNIDFENGGIDSVWTSKEVECITDVTTKAVRVMPATIPLLFELGMDHSRTEPSGFTIPSLKILEDLKLRQKQAEGVFFDEKGDLVAFDVSRITPTYKGMVIRLDAVKTFLEQNDLVLFWTCIGEKEYFINPTRCLRSAWSSFVYLDDSEKAVGDYQLQESDTDMS